MRRGAGWMVALVLAACAQTPPARAPLPDVAELVASPAPCGVMVGDPQGALIDEVLPGTAAAGVLLAGDVVTEVEGEAVTTSAALRQALAGMRVGERIEITVVRGGASLSPEVTLAPHPEDPDRPLLGVVITTAFRRVPPSELPADLPGGSFARVVEVEGTLVAFDPVTGEAGRLRWEVPPESWFVRRGVPWWLDRESGRLLSASQGHTQPRLVGWSLLRLAGAVGPDLVATVVGDGAAGEQLGLARFDPESGRVHWVWEAAGVVGVPLAALPSPDGTRLLVVTGDVEEPSRFRYLVIGSENPEDAGLLRGLSGGGVFGWHDDNRLLAQLADGAVGLVDVSDGGDLAAVRLDLAAEDRVVAVGDGESALVVRAGRMSRVLLASEDPDSTRVLVDNCRIGSVDLPGSLSR